MKDESLEVQTAENGYVLSYDNEDDKDKDGWSRSRVRVLCNSLNDLLSAIEKKLR